MLVIASEHDSFSFAETNEIKRKRPEDSIPVIEIRGEGKPMSSAQIRALEEASNGGPLDIKVKIKRYASQRAA